MLEQDLEPFPWDGCRWVQVPVGAAGVGAPQGSSWLRGLFCALAKSRVEKNTLCYLGTVSVGYEQKSVPPGPGAAGCQHPKTPRKPGGLAASSPGAAFPPAPARAAEAPTSGQPSAAAEV